MVITAVLALRGPRWWRAAMFGTAAAIGYAFTAALTKVVTHFVAVDWTSIFSHWQTYGVALFGALSVFLTQNAFHAGPIGASQAALVLVDPLVSIAIGIALFGDNLQTAGRPRAARGPLAAAAHRRRVHRSPTPSAVAMLKGEGGSEPATCCTPRTSPGRRAARPATNSDTAATRALTS